MSRSKGTGPFGGASGGSSSATLEHPADLAREGQPVGPSIWALVFAGGIGSRFWPLATPATPKAVLPLVGGRPLVADTVGRLWPLVPPERVLVATSADIMEAVRAALPDVPRANLLVEPRPLGTAAALAWGAQEVGRRAGESAILCALHADLGAAFPELFRAAVARAAGVAAREHTVTLVGARPTRDETQFGYIVRGEPLAGEPDRHAGERHAPAPPFDVAQFVEKPSADVVGELRANGALWHTGIFVGAANDVLDALRLYAPDVAQGGKALEAGDVAAIADMVRPGSIERALFERMGRLIAIEADFGWDDVGTWASLRRVRDLDDDGNGAIGPAAFVEATGNVVHADQGTVVVFGVSQHLVVTRPGLTFVTPLDRAAELKPLLDSLPGSLRVVGGAPRTKREPPSGGTSAASPE